MLGQKVEIYFGLKYFEVVFHYVVLSFICIAKKLSNFFSM